MVKKNNIIKIILGLTMATVSGQCNASEVIPHEDLLLMIDEDLFQENEAEELSQLKQDLKLPEDASEEDLRNALIWYLGGKESYMRAMYEGYSLRKLIAKKINGDMHRFGGYFGDGRQIITQLNKQHFFASVNDKLYSYMKLYYKEPEALTYNGKFLDPLMRMLIDHPNELDGRIKKCLPFIFAILGKEYIPGNLRNAGFEIYDWMCENMEDVVEWYNPKNMEEEEENALGEYYSENMEEEETLEEYRP